MSDSQQETGSGSLLADLLFKNYGERSANSAADMQAALTRLYNAISDGKPEKEIHGWAVNLAIKSTRFEDYAGRYFMFKQNKREAATEVFEKSTKLCQDLQRDMAPADALPIIKELIKTVHKIMLGN